MLCLQISKRATFENIHYGIKKSYQHLSMSPVIIATVQENPVLPISKRKENIFSSIVVRCDDTSSTKCERALLNLSNVLWNVRTGKDVRLSSIRLDDQIDN